MPPRMLSADFVKFQTFSSDKLVTCSADTADYQRKNCNADNQREMLRQLEPVAR